MFEFLEDRYLSHDALLPLLIHEFVLFIDLDCHFAISGDMISELYSAVCSLPKSSINLIRVDTVFVEEVCAKVVKF